MLGGGSGHIADMISRYRSNISQLKRKRYFKRRGVLRMRKNYRKAAGDQFNFHNASREELFALRNKVIRQQRLGQFRALALLLVIIAIVSYYALKILDFIN